MNNQKFLDTKGVEHLWSKITPEAIGAMPADYTHRELVAKDKIGTVILGNEKQNETTNYYLRPFNKQEGEAYYLGVRLTPWDRLYTKSAVIPGNLYIGHIDGENVTEDQHNIYLKRKKKDSDELLSARVYWSNNDDYTKYNLRLNAALNGTVYNALILGDSETSFGKPVAIGSGGTGATDASTALSNLGGLEVVDARSANFDMDAILKSGTHCKIYRTNGDTLGTPYKKGATTLMSAYILSCTSGTTYGKQFAFCSGGKTYERALNNDVIADWSYVINSNGGTIYGDLVLGGNSETGITEDNHDLYIRRMVNDLAKSGRLYWNKDGQLRLNANSGDTSFNYMSLNETDTTFGKPIAISSGGTGATTPAAARENLGITGGITSAITNNFKPNVAIISNNDGKLKSSTITSTELDYLSGVTSNIQEQLNSHTHEGLTKGTDGGIVKLGHDTSSSGIRNYYLKPDRTQTSDNYLLGSSGSHWNKAYIDRIILSDGEDAASQSWVKSYVKDQVSDFKAWEDSY